MRLLFLLLTLSVTLFSEEIPLVFEADVADYQDHQITLEGHVLVEHESGSLMSGRAYIQGGSEGKKLRLSKIDLYDQVVFDMIEGGQLHCAEAHLVQENFAGDFLGCPSQPFVVYSEECSSEKFPLIVKSKQMHVEFNDSKNYINSIVAQNQVTVDYNHDFIAAADKATFHREEVENKSTTGLAGIICLQAEEEDGYCSITNRNGDLIQARQIFLDTGKRRICFTRPKGALYKEKERLDFSADTLHFDEQQGILNLTGAVSLAEEGFGELTTDDKLTLFQDKSNGKKLLKRMESLGNCSLVNQALNYCLNCSGKVTVDHLNQKVSLVAAQNQVSYEDQYGSFLADQVILEYHWVENQLKPLLIRLTGNVKMISKKENGKQQFALADRVVVLPDEQEADLTADEERRVLVLDQVNEMQVSAKGIKIKRDLVTKKESIRGTGDVRFYLMGQEMEQLYKHFEQFQKLGVKNG